MSSSITDSNQLDKLNTDWMKKHIGRSALALSPSNVEELASIVAYCNKRRLAIVPQGGNTGLVGGGVPLFDEVIISTLRMNKVLAFDPIGGQVVAEAGCTLGDVERHVQQYGWMMPYSFGSKETCVVGGNVATGAGGMRLLRYGGMQGSVLGLECVTGQGTVLNLMSTMRKDNTGLQLKNIFVTPPYRRRLRLKIFGAPGERCDLPLAKYACKAKYKGAICW